MAKKWIILVLFIGVLLTPPLWEEDMWKQSIEKISAMFSLIEANYYKDVDHKELAYASIKGMLPTLDPHSYFLDPTNLATLTEDYRGKYFGIGCLIQKHADLLKVISPIEGGPSYRLGILPNDVELPVTVADIPPEMQARVKNGFYFPGYENASSYPRLFDLLERELPADGHEPFLEDFAWNNVRAFLERIDG